MNYLCEVRTVFRHAMRLQSSRLSVAKYSKNVEPKEDEVYDEDKHGKLGVEDVLKDDIDVEERERQIELMRNKSRLNKTHRNVVFNQPLPDEEYQWDKTLYYTRKQFGKFGSKAGIDPRLCFYTPEELADHAEYERVAYPYTIQEVVASNKKAKAEKLEAIRQRENKIAANLTKLDKWMEDLKIRIAQKEKDAIAAKEKRAQLLEDIRREVGFKIDFKDPRFQALMEKKELEEKKAKKAQKKAKNEARTAERLKQQAQNLTAEANDDAKKVEESKVDEKNDANEDEVAAKSQPAPKEKAKKGKAKTKDDQKKDDSSSSSDSESDDEDNKKKKK